MSGRRKTNPRALARLPAEIAAAVRDARLARGMTRVALARRSGLSESAMARIEAGQRRCSLLELAAIADALDIDPVELFGRVLRTLRS